MKINDLYNECNDFTMYTNKVASTVVLSPSEYVEMQMNYMTFYDKPIFIQLSTCSHLLFTVQEWINLGCPKTMEEGRMQGWNSIPYSKELEKEM